MGILDWLIPSDKIGGDFLEQFLYAVLNIFMLGLIWFCVNAVTTTLRNVSFMKSKPTSLWATLTISVLSIPIVAALLVLLDK